MQTPLELDPALLALASPQELAGYKAAVERELALLSPLDFAIFLYPERVQRFPHTELLNRYAVALTERALYQSGIGPPAVWVTEPDDPLDGRWLHPLTGERAVDILVVSAPPRHGKSFLLTETFPAWYLAKFPDHRVAVTGYEADFAKGFGRKNRSKIDAAAEASPPLCPPVSTDTRAADKWEIKGTNGGMQTAGSGGPLTGSGFHAIVIDDPVKNSQEALSPTSRQSNWDWWLSTVKNRLEYKTSGVIEPQRECGIVINIQTRWHEDDLAGRMIRSEKCYVLNLPALAFEDFDPETGISRDPETGVPDPLNRKPGEPLSPLQFTRSKLLDIRENGDDTGENPGGMLWFSANYQGKPTVEGGGILPKPFLHFIPEADPQGRISYPLQGSEHARKTECIMFGIVDVANTVKKRSDFTAMSYWAWTPRGNLLLLDVNRFRMESPDHEAKTREWWRNMQSRHGAGRFLGIEDRTFGSSLIQNMVRTGGIPIRPLKADKDKIERAIPAGAMMREGRVWFCDTEATSSWLPDFERELAGFPNTTHDDQVDNLAYAVEVARTLPIKNTGPQENTPITTERLVSEILHDHDRKKKRGAQRIPIIGRW